MPRSYARVVIHFQPRRVEEQGKSAVRPLTVRVAACVRIHRDCQTLHDTVEAVFAKRIPVPSRGFLQFQYSSRYGHTASPATMLSDDGHLHVASEPDNLLD